MVAEAVNYRNEQSLKRGEKWSWSIFVFILFANHDKECQYWNSLSWFDEKQLLPLMCMLYYKNIPLEMLSFFFLGHLLHGSKDIFCQYGQLLYYL